MEKTTTQRIIGVLVVIALVIILLPLLFDKNEAATKVASVKAPPFPDQQAQDKNVAATPETNVVASADQKNAPTFIDIPPEVADQINQTANTTEPQPDVNKPTEVAPPEPTAIPIQTVKSAEENTATIPSKTDTLKSAPANPTPPSELISNATPNDAKPVVEKIIKAVDMHPTEVEHPKHNRIKHVKTASSTKSDNTALKKSAWAVQLGSFKNKENARRLADKLRASGYKAFMHEIKSAKGGAQTRVYIGPEYKQAFAVKLSTQLEQTMNLHGLVIPYKPLDL